MTWRLSTTLKSIMKKPYLSVPLGPASVTPGEILEEEFLKPTELSQSELAGRMGVGRMRVSEIVRGHRAITAETAILLAGALGTTAKFWMNLQTSYDLAKAAIKMRAAKTVRAA
jgi:addiction module HigA family antidote